MCQEPILKQVTGQPKKTEKKSEQVKDTPKKESAPTKASVNVTIREDWGGDTDYRSLIFCQVTAETATNKNPKM